MCEGYDSWGTSVCTQTASGKLDPKPVEGFSTATGSTGRAGNSFLQHQSSQCRKTCMWSFPHLEAVPDTIGMKSLQLQRVQLNSDVNNTK